MGKTNIQWAQRVWNPVRGCSRVSAGCDNCYAIGQAHRFSGPGQPYEGLTRIGKRSGKPDWSGVVRLVPAALAEPLRVRRPQRWFVNSMSDLFHDGLSNVEIGAVFGVMAAAPQHTFLVLTKRPDRMRRWFEQAQREAMKGDHWARVPQFTEECAREAMPVDRLPAIGETQPWPLPNVWVGVSVEDQSTADERIPDLLETPAAIRFVSYEPALGPVDLGHWLAHCARCQQRYTLRHHGRCDDEGAEGASVHFICGGDVVGLDWVIVGGESGPGARPFDLDWARQTIRACKKAGVPVFMKQAGSKPGWWVEDATPVDVRFADRKGGDPAEWPEDLRVREVPEART